MPAYRVPSMAESEFLTQGTMAEAAPELPQTCLLGITIFIHEKRIAYRPNLWPAIRATDLATEAYLVIMDAFPGAEYTAIDLSGFMQQATDAHVFVRLEGPPGMYIRTLEEVEGDAKLWEEVLNYEFPRRHVIMKHWEASRGKKRRFEEDEETELPASKRVCVHTITEEVRALEIDEAKTMMGAFGDLEIEDVQIFS